MFHFRSAEVTGICGQKRSANVVKIYRGFAITVWSRLQREGRITLEMTEGDDLAITSPAPPEMGVFNQIPQTSPYQGTTNRVRYLLGHHYDVRVNLKVINAIAVDAVNRHLVRW